MRKRIVSDELIDIADVRTTHDVLWMGEDCGDRILRSYGRTGETVTASSFDELLRRGKFKMYDRIIAPLSHATSCLEDLVSINAGLLVITGLPSKVVADALAQRISALFAPAGAWAVSTTCSGFCVVTDASGYPVATMVPATADEIEKFAEAMR